MTGDPLLNSWRRFACAYLIRSLRDACNPTAPDLEQKIPDAREARAWLASDEARGLVLLLGYDPRKLERLLRELEDLPDPPREVAEQLTLEGLEGFLYD